MHLVRAGRQGEICLLVGEEMLPILAEEERIVDAVRENQVVIVVGETGSGKSTQMPQFFHRAGLASSGKIGITQPRRIAATSVAGFVARELGVSLGSTVGYQVRFDDTTTEGTEVKFMTDGILLRELQIDPDLRKYSLIMVDEAHERSQNIDFVLGLLKGVLRRRPDFKVVVASATIDQDKFSRYFWDAPVVSVSGRTFPVEIKWAKESVSPFDMEQPVVDMVEHIHRTAKQGGDILVFMPGEKEIRKVIGLLEKRGLSGLVTLPLFGAMSAEDQGKVFQKFPGRKVIVATNVAETSITVDGVVFVVDSGFIKQANFHTETGIESLDVVEHSQAGCNQRAGRAGRTQPGVCYRMYTPSNFEARPEHTKPEIQRVGLASIVLAMESIGLDDIENFDFIDPPAKKAFHEAYETLIALGAISRGRKGLTETGKAMARLPLAPHLARMLLEAEKYGCVEEVVTVAAFLSVRTVYLRPKGKEDEADDAHDRFKKRASDMLTYLAIWEAFESGGASNFWCRENFLSFKALQEVTSVRAQLVDILERRGIVLSSSDDKQLVSKAVASGLVYNLFQREGRFGYGSVFRDNLYAQVFIHPGSSMFGTATQWFVAAEVVETSKVFARGCSRVDATWLPDLIPHLATYGEEEIVEVLPEGDILVRQSILFKGDVVGWKEGMVSLEEVHRIQEQRVRKAEAQGLRRLVFSLKKGVNSWDDRFVAHSGLQSFSASLIGSSIVPGVTYYCKKDQFFGLDFSLSYSGVERVQPVFQVFDLPLLQKDEAEEGAQEEASKLSKPLDLSALSERWGAKVKGA